MHTQKGNHEKHIMKTEISLALAQTGQNLHISLSQMPMVHTQYMQKRKTGQAAVQADLRLFTGSSHMQLGIFFMLWQSFLQ